MTPAITLLIKQLIFNIMLLEENTKQEETLDATRKMLFMQHIVLNV